MEFIEQLKLRFANLSAEYLSLIDGVTKTPGQVVYCDQDIFTLEPFYAEINNLPHRQVKLVDTPEELNGSQIFQLLLSGDKALLHREWLGDDCYYDGIFLYPDQQKIRIVVYVKNNDVKPVRLEVVKFNEKGLYENFYSISPYGIEELHYQYSGLSTKIDRFRIGEDINSREYIYTYNLYRSTKDYSISHIELIHNNEHTLIYDARFTSLPLQELLELALKRKVNDIINACSQDELKDKKIHCLLIEYSSQSPMLSSLALIQQHEVVYGKNEHPLTWLHAPDAELFMNQPETESNSIYDPIDRLLNNFQDQEFHEVELDNSIGESYKPRSHDLIKNFYISLCKKLKLKLRQKAIFDMTDDFYVCARDYEACNEEEYLQAILPARQFTKIRRAIENYTKILEKQTLDDPAQHLINEMKARAEVLLPNLIDKAESAPKDYWYSDERLYFIEPFGFEIRTGQAAEYWRDLLSREIPESSFYFRYQMNGELPIAIAHISDNKIVRQWFWEVKPLQVFEIEQYCFKGKPFVESCCLLELENNKAISYSEFCLTYERTDYQWDTSDKIVQSHFRRSFPGHPEVDSGLDMFYEYQDGKISKIYRKPSEWDDDERFCIFFPRQNFDDLK